MKTTATRICGMAAALVDGDRAASHGDKLENFANIAAFWNAILRAKSRGWPRAIVLDEVDVCNMMEAMKIARRYSGSHNLDDYVDGAGYAGCAGEIAEQLNEKET